MSIEAMTKIDNLKSWTSGVDVDWESLNQLRNIAALPVLAGHVAVMPDVHFGAVAITHREARTPYTDIDTVMAAQTDLVEVEHTLKQVMCIKG